jgi:hypothetical protein
MRFPVVIGAKPIPMPKLFPPPDESVAAGPVFPDAGAGCAYQADASAGTYRVPVADGNVFLDQVILPGEQDNAGGAIRGHGYAGHAAAGAAIEPDAAIPE